MQSTCNLEFLLQVAMVTILDVPVATRVKLQGDTKHSQTVVRIKATANIPMFFLFLTFQNYHIDGLMQERRNSSALAMELRLSCLNPSIYKIVCYRYFDFYAIIHLISVVFALFHYAKSVCTVSSLCPSDVIYSDIELGQHWFRWWHVAWRHQAITWTNADLSSLRSSDIHLMEVSRDAPTISSWN